MMLPYNAARLCSQLGQQARQRPLGIAGINEVCGLDIHTPDTTAVW